MSGVIFELANELRLFTIVIIKALFELFECRLRGQVFLRRVQIFYTLSEQLVRLINLRLGVLIFLLC